MLNMRLEIFGVIKSDEGLAQLEAAALHCADVADDLSPARIHDYLLDLATTNKPLVMTVENVDGDMTHLREQLRSHKLAYRCSYAEVDADQYDTMAVYGPTLDSEVLVDLTTPPEAKPFKSVEQIIEEIKTSTPEQLKARERADLVDFLRNDTDSGLMFDKEMSQKLGVSRKFPY